MPSKEAPPQLYDALTKKSPPLLSSSSFFVLASPHLNFLAKPSRRSHSRQAGCCVLLLRPHGTMRPRGAFHTPPSGSPAPSSCGRAGVRCGGGGEGPCSACSAGRTAPASVARCITHAPSAHKPPPAGRAVLPGQAGTGASAEKTSALLLQAAWWPGAMTATEHRLRAFCKRYSSACFPHKQVQACEDGRACVRVCVACTCCFCGFREPNSNWQGLCAAPSTRSVVRHGQPVPPWLVLLPRGCRPAVALRCIGIGRQGQQ